MNFWEDAYLGDILTNVSNRKYKAKGRKKAATQPFAIFLAHANISSSSLPDLADMNLSRVLAIRIGHEVKKRVSVQ